jgi:SAM-dependent methyltransferase
VINYHLAGKGQTGLCVDLGCGHGVVSRALAPNFDRIIGTDPSEVMVKQASSSTKEPNVEFRQGSAEDLDFLDDGSVDLVVAGQAAHWFDFSKVWPVLQRKVRKGGTLAFWGYKDHYFVDYPKATKILDHYCYGPGEDLLGMYWEQPGRNILRDRLHAIVPPESEWHDLRRVEYEPGTNGPGSGTLGEKLMYRRLSLGQLEGYGRTFSSFHGWQEAHPARKSRADGGPGDVVDEMFEVMLEAEPEWKKEGDNWREKEVEVEWGSAILMARKK